ncbi:MAG: hypothetical protein U9P10_01445 [Thermodesulfobacteriota bacterium]|nr:hypothetical protein [Thermodesulfobacteriota bacterium]
MRTYIDADMRRPVQHKHTHVSNENGLSAFLAGVTSSDIIVSDPLLISRNVEGVAIVAMSSSTTHEILHKGVKAFREIAAPITGIVLNRFDAKKSGYYYGYGDYYYYSSETSVKDKKETT